MCTYDEQFTKVTPIKLYTMGDFDRISATMVSRLYLNLKEQMEDRVIIHNTGATSVGNRDLDTLTIATWVVRVTDEMNVDSVLYDDDTTYMNI